MKKTKELVLMHVDYDEFNADSYRGIYVNGLDCKSYTKDPIADYKAVSKQIDQYRNDYTVGLSSDFDNFLMDSGKYDYILKNGRVLGLKLSKKKK